MSSLLLSLAARDSLAQMSRASLPFSGISPGGVDMSTGELILVMRPDLAIDGPLPVIFQRYYASLLATDGFASGHLGPNWLSTYDWSLSVVGSNATLVTNRGAVIRFTSGSGGTWGLASPTYAKFKLDVLPGGTWRFTNPMDRRLYLFDGVTWRLNQIEDERGNSLSLTYGPAGGLLTQVSDGGRFLNFTYDPTTGRLTQVSDGTRTVHYSYASGGGVLTSFTDAAGRVWGYASNPGPIQGLLVGVTEPLGNTPMTQAFDATGRVTSQTDAAGHVATYSYGGATGNVFTDPLFNPWSYQHDASGRLTTLTDPIGGPTTFMYDPLGRLSMTARPMGDPKSFTYDALSGYPSMVSFADGSSINWGYGSHSVGGATIFDLSMAMFADGTTESFGRDISGNITDLTDQTGNHWLGTYNARGQILTWTNPAGGVTTFTYDPLGRPATCRDHAGNTTNYGYDALGRLTQTTWPGGTSRTYAYDALDELTSLTDERGKLWSYAWDEDHRLMMTTDPLLQATGYAYDALDRVIQVTDPLAHGTQYTYDANGRLMTATDRSGRTTSYQYDGLNRITGVLDPAGGLDAFGWDEDSRMISSQDPLGHTTSFVYDMLDRVTHVTDPVGTGYDYGYDIMGRLLTATAPLGHTKSFTYDTRGLLSSFLDGTSETVYARTVLGQISLVTDPNHNGWPRSYDPQGRLITAADPLGRTTMYEYDALSRPFHISRPDGSLIQINYDPAGRVTGETFGAAGPSLSYAYDDANRLTGATGASFIYDAAGRMTSSNGFGMTFDPEGRLLSETLSPGKVVSYSYESRGLLSQATDWMGGVTSFSYDAARRLTGVTRPNGTNATYAYDNADRLTSAVEKAPGPAQISSLAIARDALGQATSIDRRVPLMPGQTMASNASFTYDPASQMNGVAHDPLGRMTSDASRSFQWDGASRLMHYAAGADSPSFTYDAFGKILSSSQGSQITTMGWNYGHNPPTNDDLQVSLPSRFDLCVRAPSGLMLYKVNGSTGERSYYHYDEAGNTAYLTNDVGSVVTSYAYGPFGGVTGLGQTAGNPYTYGAAVGTMSLGAGSSGLWAANAPTYDDHTMRGISGNTTHSGIAAVVLGQGGEIHSDKHGRIKVQFHWDREGKPDASSSPWLNPQPFPPAPGGDVQGPRPWPWVSAELNPQPFPPAPQGGGNPWDPGPGLFTPITFAELVLAMGPQRATRLGDGDDAFAARRRRSSILGGDLGDGGSYQGRGDESPGWIPNVTIRTPPGEESDAFENAWEITDVGKNANSGNGMDLNCDGTLSSPSHHEAAPCVWCPR